MNAPKGKYAWTATVGEKGQIVIPKQARDIFGIKPGDTLLLLGDEQRGIAIPPKGAFTELFGIAYGEKDGDGDSLLHSRARSYKSYASRCGRVGSAWEHSQILFV